MGVASYPGVLDNATVFYYCSVTDFPIITPLIIKFFLSEFLKFFQQHFIIPVSRPQKSISRKHPVKWNHTATPIFIAYLQPYSYQLFFSLFQNAVSKLRMISGC